jgi:hypothetical protein
MGESSPGWGVIVLNRFCTVLVFLSIALALAVERRPTAWAWRVQVAAALVALAFVVVALVKLYAASSAFSGYGLAVAWAAEAGIVASGALAFGLIGPRASASGARISFVAVACASLAGAVYATTLELEIKAFVWYAVAGAAATLAGSAAARMRRI